MDGGMYEHSAVQANLATLKNRGVTVIEPSEGRMASGLFGKGRLAEPEQLFQQIRFALRSKMTNCKVLVTAGPTVEKVDPVRYLTNRSTGKQGVAIAQAFVDAGADVTLIAGPIQIPTSFGCTVIPVQSAEEMHQAVMTELPKQDVLVMTAAVADYRPANVADKKIKKGDVIYEAEFYI